MTSDNGHDPGSDPTGAVQPAPRSGSGRRIIAGIAAVIIVLVLVGFVRFAAEVSRDVAGPPPGPADGIVVFTGGQDRISGALELLASGRAKRLLISGVNPATTREMLSAYTGIEDRLFRCCIDLDKRARDTIGNAGETAAWAQANGFTSLIVVTSNYHMPRSLTELGHALPGVRLQGHPIVTPSVDLAQWWRDIGAVRLLAWEYVKYLATNVRLALSPDAAQGHRRAGSL